MGDIIDPISLLFHVLNLVLLYVIVRVFLYKRLTAFMDARTAKYADERAELDQLRAEVDSQLNQIREILATARQDAEAQAQEIIANAEEEAKRIVADAEVRARDHAGLIEYEAEEDAKRVRESARNEVAKMAIGVASRVLRRELDKAAHQSMIDDFLQKVD